MRNDKAVEDFLGKGPLIDLLCRWRSGAIGAAVACQAAQAESVLDALPPAELARLSDRCVRWGYQGHWQDSLQLHRMLLVALRARPAVYAGGAPNIVTQHLRVATQALWRQIDPVLYHEALALGETTWRELPDSATRSALAYEIGILHLDPWAASRNVDDHRRWWAPAAAAATDEVGPKLPDGAAALDLAELWLRRALQVAEGVQRLQTLKALLQLLYSRPLFGGRIDMHAASAWLVEAKQLLPLAPHRQDIASYLARVDQAQDWDQDQDHIQAESAPESRPAATYNLADLLTSDWPAQVQGLGVDLVADKLLAVLRAEQGSNRRQALALAGQVQWIFEQIAPEAMRLGFQREVVRLLTDAHAKAPADATAVQALLRGIAVAAPGAAQRDHDIATALGWVRAWVAQDQEKQAAALVSVLAKAAPDLLQHWAPALNLLQTELQIGAGVNRLRAGDADGAAQAYHAAFVQAHGIGFHALALSLLSRIADVLPKATARTAQVLCELVREQPAPTAPELDDAWQIACARLAGAATAALEAGAGPEAWFGAARLAKGPAYANVLLAGQAWDWRADAQASALMSQVRALRGQAASQTGGAPVLEAGRLFEEVLVSYRSRPLPEGGDNAAQQRDNLARRLDQHVRLALAERSPPPPQRFDLDALVAELPEDAVLLDLWLPDEPSGSAYCYVLAITREGSRLFGTQMTAQLLRGVSMQGSTSDNEMTVAGLTVALLRAAVQANQDAADPQSAGSVTAQMAQASRMFLGAVLEWLAEQRAAGKRQLLVVPCGPLHFLPLQLLGLKGRLLAEDWSVSMLPSMDLLRRPAGADGVDGPIGTAGAAAAAGVAPPPRRLDRAAVFGLTYTDAAGRALGLRPLSGVYAECAAVAKSLGVSVTPEPQTIVARVLQALQTARVVHLACHGEHDVVAPSLQCLRLLPSADDDGRLAAIDLLALDLRGLKVLSLSACETALGRVDVGGNPLGLAAIALARGAETVLGTLWPCADAVSALFFARFHARLAQGRSRLEAFRSAQQLTRQHYPQWRDWAAFYLSGDWS